MTSATPIEFNYGGRLFRVAYFADRRAVLQEFVTPKSRATYWRTIPKRGRWRALHQEIMGGRSKADFIRMSKKGSIAMNDETHNDNGVPYDGRAAMRSGWGISANPYKSGDWRSMRWTSEWWAENADCYRSHCESIPVYLAGAPLELPYKNWRGEVSTRKIQPIRLEFGSTEWHKEPQWLLIAWDIEKDAERSFALKDFNPAPPAPSTPAIDLKDGKWEARISVIARAVRQSLRNYGHKVAESVLPECIAADVESALSRHATPTEVTYESGCELLDPNRDRLFSLGGTDKEPKSEPATVHECAAYAMPPKGEDAAEKLAAVLSLLGNVEFTGGGFEEARRYADKLNDIRAILSASKNGGA